MNHPLTSMTREMAHFKSLLMTWGVAILGLQFSGFFIALLGMESSNFAEFLSFHFFYTWVSSLLALFVVLVAWTFLALPYAILVLKRFADAPAWKHGLAGASLGLLPVLLISEFGSLILPFVGIAGIAGYFGAWKLAKLYQLINQDGLIDKPRRFTSRYPLMNPTQTTPAQLTIYFDGHCGLCTQARQWLTQEPMRLPVFLEDLHAASSQAQFTTCSLDPEKQLLVGDGQGNWWHGSDAWLMVLWATERYALWSLKLAETRWRPLMRHLIANISNHRHGLSRLLGLKPSDQFLQKLEAQRQEAEVTERISEQKNSSASRVPNAYLGYQKATNRTASSLEGMTLGKPTLPERKTPTSSPSQHPKPAPQSDSPRANSGRE